MAMVHLLLFAAVAIYASISRAQSTTTTPTLGPLLTGSCSSSYKTSFFSTHHYTSPTGTVTYTFASTTSVYVPTSNSELVKVIYTTLGCLPNQTACCPFPVAAPSIDPSNSSSTVFADIPTNTILPSCPPDYSTTYYSPPSGTASAQALCCPSGWGVYDNSLPLPGTGDTNPCFSPLAAYPAQGGQPVYISAGDNTEEHENVYAVFTRSYLVETDGKGKGGKGKVVAIAVPVVVVILALFVGIGFWWRKKSQKSQMKTDTTQPGVPELGEGLRHEIGGRSLGAVEPKEVDVNVAELDTRLREPKNEQGGVELDSMDVREMGANVPAAHEVGAKDEISSDKLFGRAELM